MKGWKKQTNKKKKTWCIQINYYFFKATVYSI